MALKKVQSLCPDCYLVDGMDTPMDVRPGQALRCSRGHTWGSGGDSDFGGAASSMEIYDQRQAMARHKRAQMAKQENPEAAVQEQAQGPVVPAAVQQNTGEELVIDKENRARISALVGEFNDAATLFGTIFALSQDIRDLQDQLKAAMSAQQASAGAQARPAGDDPGMLREHAGDMAVTVLIPERHVVPLKDIAEAQGTDVPSYVNTIISGGLDNSWFY